MLISDLNILSSGPQISIPVPLSLDHPQVRWITQSVGKVYKLTRVIKRDEVHIKFQHSVDLVYVQHVLPTSFDKKYENSESKHTWPYGNRELKIC